MPQPQQHQPSDLEQLAQIMQFVQPFQQQQQQQEQQHQLMQWHMQGLQQQEAERRAELAFKQQQLQQSGQEHTDALTEQRRQHDLMMQKADQQEAGQALMQMDKLGVPLTMNPLHLALVDRAYGPQLSPAIKEGLVNTEAAKFMTPVQQMYAAHKAKPDLAALQKGLDIYMPSVWDKMHPAVQAKVGEMFQGLNAGMTTPAPSAGGFNFDLAAQNNPDLQNLVQQHLVGRAQQLELNKQVEAQALKQAERNKLLDTMGYPGQARENPFSVLNKL